MNYVIAKKKILNKSLPVTSILLRFYSNIFHHLVIPVDVALMVGF